MTVDITQAERESGVSKALMRKWEIRYGFPKPKRDDNGDRLYSAAEVHQLRLTRHLLDYGYRASKVVGLSVQELSAILAKHSDKEISSITGPLSEQVANHLANGDFNGLSRLFEEACVSNGLINFVQSILPVLIKNIDLGWEQGKIAIYEEHLFSEVLRSVLQRFSSSFECKENAISVLMCTAPDEHHGMGLCMLQAVLSARGIKCINLGVQVPEIEVLKACVNYRADVVALSFSLAFSTRNITPCVTSLRMQLPPEVALWVGGSGVKKIRTAWPGVLRFKDLGAVAERVAKMRRLP